MNFTAIPKVYVHPFQFWNVDDGAWFVQTRHDRNVEPDVIHSCWDGVDAPQASASDTDDARYYFATVKVDYPRHGLQILGRVVSPARRLTDEWDDDDEETLRLEARLFLADWFRDDESTVWIEWQGDGSEEEIE